MSFGNLLLASSAFSISTIKAGLNIYRAQPDTAKMVKDSLIPAAVSAFAAYSTQAAVNQIINQPGLYGRNLIAGSGVGIGLVIAPIVAVLLEELVVILGHATGKFDYRGGFLIPQAPAPIPVAPAALTPNRLYLMT